MNALVLIVISNAIAITKFVTDQLIWETDERMNRAVRWMGIIHVAVTLTYSFTDRLLVGYVWYQVEYCTTERPNIPNISNDYWRRPLLATCLRWPAHTSTHTQTRTRTGQINRMTLGLHCMMMMGGRSRTELLVPCTRHLSVGLQRNVWRSEQSQQWRSHPHLLVFLLRLFFSISLVYLNGWFSPGKWQTTSLDNKPTAPL